MFDFFFRYFLVFPKILLYEHWGILIGEVVLILYWPYFLAKRKRLGVNDLLVSYYLFAIYYIFISSLISGLSFGFFPVHAAFYLVRLLLLFGIFVWAYTTYNDYENNREVVERVFNKPFFVHFILGLIVVIFFYIEFHPTANDILWDYKVGLRMVPFAGMVLDPNGFFYLNVVSGSGNLLSGWALGILIINFNLGKGNFSKTILIIAVLTVLLTVSRGGFLTMAIYLIYRYFKDFDGKVSLKVVALLIFFGFALVVYITLTATTPLPNVFERLVNTHDSSGFDGSTVGRLDNYVALIHTWVTKIQYVVFGFGFDEDTLMATSQQTVVESFYLEIIVCSGIIGVVLYAIFIITSFIKNKMNYWYHCLWEFLVFQSVIAWTVTGGDFFAPHASYLMMTFIGFGLASQNLKNTQYESPSVR